MIGEIITNSSWATLAIPNANLPPGFLHCDGSAINRTTFAALFAVIGTMYGAGDGSTTFNLPDFRGMFLRGWDHGAGIDPDAASRTARGDGTGGDVVGSKQTHSIGTHTHTQPSTADTGDTTNYVAYGGVETSTQNNITGESRPKNRNVRFLIQYE